MAGIAAVLKAIARAQWRDLRSLQSIAANNFFLFVVLLMQDPKSAGFFILLIGVLVLFPLSADPLRTVPPDRLELWPFTRTQLVVLRVASVGLSPIAWILALLLLRTARLRPVVELAIVFAVLQAILAVSKLVSRRAPHWNVLRLVPPFPGALGGLIRKDVRQIVCTLDFYLACLLAAGGVVYRVVSAAPDRAALQILALMVVLMLSTLAQCLFGLDGQAGLMRYRLMPMRGWRILLAKDAAWLLTLAPLIVVLSPTVGLTAGFAALAVGHDASVRRPVPQHRWRFTSGQPLPAGLIQVILMFATGTAVDRLSLWFLPGSAALWAASVLLYGFLWDRQVGLRHEGL
jgi:hypothetical protein